MSKPSTGKRQLPVGFKPSAASVVIAKGRRIKLHPGNQKLQEVVEVYRAAYEEGLGYPPGKRRMVRSRIISDIISTTSEKCPVEPFVKFDGKRYWIPEELSIREKISALFRNNLSDKYRSSSQNKSLRRRRALILKKKQRGKNSLRESPKGQLSKLQDCLSEGMPWDQRFAPQKSNDTKIIGKPAAISDDSSGGEGAASESLSDDDTVSATIVPDEQVSSAPADIVTPPILVSSCSLGDVISERSAHVISEDGSSGGQHQHLDDDVFSLSGDYCAGIDDAGATLPSIGFV